MTGKKVAIIGTVGVPAIYGGFETLVENLIKCHEALSLKESLTVYCSSRSYPSKLKSFHSAHLRYVPLAANGFQSVAYDIFSMTSACWNRNEVILLLGVSGAIALPIFRFFSSAKFITNIDGIEWRRAKWNFIAKCFLRFSEKMAVRFSHVVIADNEAIANYVKNIYGVNCHVIAYGGDHALSVEKMSLNMVGLPETYSFSVCRIEPENNIEMILEAFSRVGLVKAELVDNNNVRKLVMVGNWSGSSYGRSLRERFSECDNIFMLDPIYDLRVLKGLRANSLLYIHGHSAGGTNPSLVEAMHFSKPIFVFDCSYNRYSTEGDAMFFGDSHGLVQLINAFNSTNAKTDGKKMMEIASRRYLWKNISKQYFDLFYD